MTPIEYLYYFGYSLHKLYGLSVKKRLGGRTISVGNLTLGGTGKTPLIIAIAEEAIKRKFRTCILTRGYKGNVTGSVIVSIGNGPLTPWRDAGDEPFLMAERAKGTWIVKDSNRYRGGLIARGMDIYLLDDGFQHRRLDRDVDILLIDATNPFGNGRLFPLGRLREPLKEMKRADIILVNKAKERKMDLEEKIRVYNDKARIFHSTYRIEGLIDITGKGLPIEEIRGKGVFAFAGIGTPGYFLTTLNEIGISVSGFLPFRDHYCYREDDIKKIMKKAEEASAELIITTEKDMVKIRDFELAGKIKNIYAMRIALEIFDKKFYDIIFDKPLP